MNATLDQLKEEHAEHVIGPELKTLLERVVRATARAYPPAEYAQAASWDSEALADALQDWVEVRLLRRGDLSKLLAGAPSVEGLRRGLTRSFEQFLTNRRRRTSATNLYQRTTKMLRSDGAFGKVGQAARSHEQLWTLAELQGTVEGPTMVAVPALVAIAFELDDDRLEVVRYGPSRSSRRRSCASRNYASSLSTCSVGPAAPSTRRRLPTSCAGASRCMRSRWRS